MFTLDISAIGAACGKNPYESREKTIFSQICKTNGAYYLERLLEKGIISKNKIESSDVEFTNIYKKFKKDIKDPSQFSQVEEKVLEEFKRKEPNAPTDNLVHKMRNSMKKDCGTNNEKNVIIQKKYTSGNNKLLSYKSKDGWELRGFHDATQGDILIEVKTRMSQKNVRKNEYDLYQLFGYLLATGNKKGKIVQMFNKQIYDSDIPTDYEYGLIDLDIEYWSYKFRIFELELEKFFSDVSFVCSKNFDVDKLFENVTWPIAEIDKNKCLCNVNPKYEKLLNLLKKYIR